jgi:putative transposase
MLVDAKLKYAADSEWGSRRYLDVSLLEKRSCRRRAGG